MDLGTVDAAWLLVSAVVLLFSNAAWLYYVKRKPREAQSPVLQSNKKES